MLKQNNKGSVLGIEYKSYFQFDVQQNKCNLYKIFYFKQININKIAYLNNITIFCSLGTANSSQIIMFYPDSTGKIKSTIIRNAFPITDCFKNSSYIVEYENGFLSVIGQDLY
jgi:hypothetical protein